MKCKNYIKYIKTTFKKLDHIEQTLISKDKSPTDRKHATLNKGDEDISKAHSGSIQINGSFSNAKCSKLKRKCNTNVHSNMQEILSLKIICLHY